VAPSLLRVEGLTIEIETPSARIRPVRDVSLSLAPSETWRWWARAAREKTLTGLACSACCHRRWRSSAAGCCSSTAPGGRANLADLSEAEMRALRGDEIAMVFQDPGSNLNPVHRVGDQVAEVIRAHRDVSSAAAAAHAIALLKDVGLPNPGAAITRLSA